MKEFYKLKLDDGGRNYSTRPAQTNDCAVRSLSIITNRLYDYVYDILAEAGRKPCDGFYIDAWLKDNNGKVLGGKFREIKRVDATPMNFSSLFPRGRYLLGTDTHVWAYVNGTHRDLWRVKQDAPLTSIWKFTKR